MDMHTTLNILTTPMPNGAQGIRLGMRNGVEPLRLALQALSTHEVNLLDPRLGVRDILRAGGSLGRLIAHVTPVTELVSTPPFPPDPDAYPWSLTINYVDRELLLRNGSGQRALHSAFSANGALHLGKTFFNHVLAEYGETNVYATRANIRVVHTRDGGHITGVDIHCPINGPDALSSILSDARGETVSPWDKPREWTQRVLESVHTCDPIAIPFFTVPDLGATVPRGFGNDCPHLTLDVPGHEFVVRDRKNTLLGKAPLDELGAASVRKTIHDELRNMGLSLQPELQPARVWQRDFAF